MEKKKRGRPAKKILTFSDVNVLSSFGVTNQTAVQTKKRGRPPKDAKQDNTKKSELSQKDQNFVTPAQPVFKQSSDTKELINKIINKEKKDKWYILTTFVRDYYIVNALDYEKYKYPIIFIGKTEHECEQQLEIIKKRKAKLAKERELEKEVDLEITKDKKTKKSTQNENDQEIDHDIEENFDDDDEI